MALIIPDTVLQKIDLKANDLMIELACYLFDKERLSMGKAKELAGLNLLDFQKELGARKIDLHYSEEDLGIDLENLGIDL